MNKYRCVYSIGARCGTEMVLKDLNLIQFSSIFGSCEIRNMDNVIKCLNSRFEILFNPEYLLYTKTMNHFKYLNDEHGNRTLNINFDNINEWHGATIAHHDLSDEKVKDHFERAITRFYKLLKHKIPTLFVFTGPNISIHKCQELAERFKQETLQFHILVCNFVEWTVTTETVKDPFFTIYDVHHETELRTILKNYDLSELISIDEIDAKRLFIK
jgi:hypothetical protein